MPKNSLSECIPNISFLTSITKLKSSPFYEKAKSGDSEAAAKLVDELMTRDGFFIPAKLVKEKYGDVIIAPVMGIEESGQNQIPQLMAEKIAEKSGGRVSDDMLLMANKPKHTGKSLAERFSYPVEFTGPVENGKKYIIVDDVSATGSSLKGLKDYIEANGGDVIGVQTLAVGRMGPDFEMKSLTREKLISKFGENNLNSFLDDQGRTLASLTEREAAFLAQFNSLLTAGVRLRGAVTKRSLEDLLGKEESGRQLNLFEREEGVLKRTIDFTDSKLSPQ
ncbi:MAG: phosphoribosyltransferase [Bacteroidetes bacterium]|nr:phosphoribosyltransferase [Bacteroidota bacterium]